MATTITVQPNQSMLDVILQAFGSMEAGMQFCIDNNISITDVPMPGAMYVLSPAATALGDANMMTKIQAGGIRFGTLGLPVADSAYVDETGSVYVDESGDVYTPE